MLGLLLGAVLLFALLGGLRAFERASVHTVKSLLAWIAALGGLSLALMLILTGRGPVALAALSLLGPLLYQHWEARRRSQPSRFRPKPKQAMTREEAYEVLGLRAGASAQDIRQAHLRLMRAAHPDAGGSDWLASRINQARDVLIG